MINIKNILLVPINETSLNEMIDLNSHLKDYANVYFLPLVDKGADGFKKKYLKIKNEINTIESNALIKEQNICKIIQLKKFKLIKKNIYKCLMCFSEFELLNKYLIKLQKKNANNLVEIYKGKLSKYNIYSAVLYDDRSKQVLPFIKACNDLKITTVIVPLAEFANIEMLMILRRNKKKYSNYKKFKNYPKLLNQYKKDPISNKYVSYYDYYTTIAYNNINILSLNPWIIGGGNANKVLVDSKIYKNEAIKNGCYDEKIIVTGMMQYDKLYNIYRDRITYKNNLINKYNLENKKKLIILSLPHHYEHKMIEWSEHIEIINQIIKSLEHFDINLIISLHPKMDEENYKHIKKYNLQIIKEKLIDVLPFVDLLITPFSTIIKWALLCKVPSVILNLYGENYSQYDKDKRIVKINSINRLNETFNEVLKTSYLDQFERSAKESSKNNLFDGCCTKRIIEEIIN